MNRPRRLSIAGLMTFVLLFALALVALRSQSTVWAGGVYLLTDAVLALAIVGAICQKGSERTWWVGFALFGIVYFRWTWTVTLPTNELLELVRPAGVKPLDKMFRTDESYWLVGHCLWSLLAATLGGVLAVAVFAVPEARPAGLEPETRREGQPARVKWRLAAAIGLTSLIPLAALILISPLSNPALWTGVLYLATWVVLGAAALGFACGRGRRRMVWLGAALFGLGYMVLNRNEDSFQEYSYVNYVSDEFLVALRPMLPEMVGGFPAKTPAIARENARIRKILDRTIPMPFRDEATLENFLNYVRAKTKEADGRELSIYVDPIELRDADKTPQDLIRMDLQHSPLSVTLGLTLKQLSLRYEVRDGMIMITSYSSDDRLPEMDYYLLAGHCILALLSAGLGAFLVPLVSDRGAVDDGRRAEGSPDLAFPSTLVIDPERGAPTIMAGVRTSEAIVEPEHHG